MEQIHSLPLRCCRCTPDPSGVKSLRMTPPERDGVELSHYQVLMKGGLVGCSMLSCLFANPPASDKDHEGR